MNMSANSRRDGARRDGLYLRHSVSALCVRLLLLSSVDPTIFTAYAVEPMIPSPDCAIAQFKYPHSSNMITPGVLQYRYLRYLESRERTPPTEEVFFLLQVLKYDPGVKQQCPGAFIVTHLFAAAVYLFRGREKNAMVDYHLDEARSLLLQLGGGREEGGDSEALRRIDKSWPVTQALEMYRDERSRLFPEEALLSTTLAAATGRDHFGSVVPNSLVPAIASVSNLDFYDPRTQLVWPELDPGKTTTMEILICHCRENLDWLKGPNFTARPSPRVEITLLIYDKCESPIGAEKTAEYMATGLFQQVKSVPCTDLRTFRRDECVAYLRYLVDRYDNYPDLVMFLQSDAEEHMYWGYMNLVMHAIAAGTSKQIPFIPLNNGRIVQNLTPCKKKIFELTFGRTPEALGTYCCAQFVVARRRLMLPKKETYELLLGMLDDQVAPKPDCNDIKGHSTHCLMYETIWHVLWGEKDVLPIRGENPELPLFLRARDVDNESHLPSGSQYMTTIMSLEEAPPEEPSPADIVASEGSEF